MSHELNSIMLFIHPPLAIAGYVFVFLFTIAMFKSHNQTKKITSLLGLTSWFLTALGLLTGMLWAQSAWGTYWSWDPKETLTLLLFLTCSASLIAYYENKHKVAKMSSTTTCGLTIITTASSFVIVGLHSFI